MEVLARVHAANELRPAADEGGPAQPVNASVAGTGVPAGRWQPRSASPSIHPHSVSHSVLIQCHTQSSLSVTHSHRLKHSAEQVMAYNLKDANMAAHEKRVAKLAQQLAHPPSPSSLALHLLPPN
eukprot:143448-Chlamydomonas_euryale.AAC.1